MFRIIVVNIDSFISNLSKVSIYILSDLFLDDSFDWVWFQDLDFLFLSWFLDDSFDWVWFQDLDFLFLSWFLDDSFDWVWFFHLSFFFFILIFLNFSFLFRMLDINLEGIIVFFLLNWLGL